MSKEQTTQTRTRIVWRRSLREKVILLTNAIQATHNQTDLQLCASHLYQSEATSVLLRACVQPHQSREKNTLLLINHFVPTPLRLTLWLKNTNLGPSLMS